MALIATTDPPLSRLKVILARRLARHDRGPDFQESGYVYKKQTFSVQASPDASKRVSSMLERVRLSRVFDFPGVAEAVAEFSARLEDNDQQREDKRDTRQHDKARGIVDSEDEAEEGLSPEAVESPQDNTEIDKNVFKTKNHSPASMIVIDNIANVVGSMITKSQVQGSFKFSSFQLGASRPTYSYQAMHYWQTSCGPFII